MWLKRILLVGIIILAALLRFNQLGHNPPSLTWDETAWGYNAYSLGIDGRDEFGKFLPVTYLESFGDFKPPMYAYLDIIPIKLFGLTEFGTRFPSAFFGTLTILVTYFLVKELFSRSEKKEWYALSAAGILAISPWHIMLSRGAFEANVASFFVITGVWLFLVAINRNMWLLWLSGISFVLSIYTFNSARVVAPLLGMCLVIIFWKKLFQNKRQTLLAGIIAIALFLPLARFLFSPQADLRFKEVNIFSDPSIVVTSNQEIANDGNSWWSKVLHNRRWLYTESFFKHYFDNISPNFLFIHGDGNPKFSTQDVGQLYLWDLPFLVVGLFFLFKKKEGYYFLIPIWLLLGIIPAATARETPHALRTEVLLPTLQILIGYGVVEVVFGMKHLLRPLWMHRLAYGVIAVALLFDLTYFLHGYYFHYAQEFSGEWQYGYKDSISYVSQVENQYSHVYVTMDLGRPYIYYLFYQKVSPQTFRKTATVSRDTFGFVTVSKIGKYNFVTTLPQSHIANALFINTPASVPHGATIKKTFYLLNGNPSLVAYTL